MNHAELYMTAMAEADAQETAGSKVAGEAYSALVWGHKAAVKAVCDSGGCVNFDFYRLAYEVTVEHFCLISKAAQVWLAEHGVGA